MKAIKVKIPCPIEECEAELTVEIHPGWPGTRVDPPEGPEITDITGCPHADGLWADIPFFDAVLEAAFEIEQAAYDRHVDALIDQERGRDW